MSNREKVVKEARRRGIEDGLAFGSAIFLLIVLIVLPLIAPLCDLIRQIARS